AGGPGAARRTAPWRGGRLTLAPGARAVGHAAGTGLGAVPELGRIARRPRLHADDARRDRQHDLVLLVVGVMRAEEAREDRDVAKTRDGIAGTRVGLLDERREDLRLPVLEAQQRVGIARGNLVGDGSRGGGNLLQDRAHFETELDRHVAVEVDGRLHLERQTDVEVLDAAGDHRRAGGGGRHAVGDDRLLAADQHLGFFLVARPDPRARQGVDQTRLLHRINRDGEGAGDVDGAGVLVRQVREHQPGGAARGGRGNVRLAERRTGGVLDAEILQAAARALQSLHFQHYRGLV